MRPTRIESYLAGGKSAWRRGAATVFSYSRTIRGRILVAFVVMTMITGTLAGYAIMGIQDAGVLVRKTYDESLMSINYARAAAADFAAMRAAFARRWIADDPAMRTRLDDAVDNLAQSLTADLKIAAERSQSQRAAQAAKNVQHAVAEWDGV